MDETMARWNEPRSLLRHASLGVEFTVIFLVPLGVGFWLDGKEGTRPGFMLLGGAIGFALGLWRVVRQARQVQKDLGREDRECRSDAAE
ncbi:MAG: AtpZ/AtpI family protein [Phycisphaerae bacterium]|nr:AtpZ/AtpI family protein [Phycisphaerae bacterium]